MKELAFRSAGRDSELLRNFLVAVALDVVQHEHCPVSVREQRKRALQIDSFTHGRNGRTWLQLLGQIEHRAAITAPQQLFRSIDPDPGQPAWEAGLPLEPSR